MNRIHALFVGFLITLLGCSSNPTKNSSNANLPTNNLIAYYPFNGSANDESGNQNNGIADGVTLTSDRFGNPNSAYHFTGGSFVVIPDLFPDTCPGFTFAAWVMKDNVDNNTHEIIYKGLDQGEAVLAITNTSNGTVLGFGVNIATGVYGAQNWYYVNVPDTLRAQLYYFLVGRYTRGGTVELLVNGQLMGTSLVPQSPLAEWPGHSSSAIGVHSQFPSTTYWNGVIDDVRIYGRALSDQEVQSLYHEGGWTGIQ